MPKMVLNRNFRLASINRPIILFEKDKEVNVRFPMYQEALYIGATVVEGETAPEIPAPKVKETPKGAARDAAVMDALELMYSRNERRIISSNWCVHNSCGRTVDEYFCLSCKSPLG